MAQVLPSLKCNIWGKLNPTTKIYVCNIFWLECSGTLTLRLLNALNSEDRGLKVRFSLATVAFDRESAQMSQMLSSQGKNAPSNPYPSDILFPLQPPPLPTPTNPPRPSHPRGLDFGPFRLRLAPFGSVWLCLAPFRVCSGSVSGVLGGVVVGLVRGASVREKNITTLSSLFSAFSNLKVSAWAWGLPDSSTLWYHEMLWKGQLGSTFWALGCRRSTVAKGPQSNESYERKSPWTTYPSTVLLRVQRSGVTPANQTKERPVHELFAGAFRNKSSMWIVLVFPRKKHQNSQKWAKFMNFSFWPFLWFGLPGRLLKRIGRREKTPTPTTRVSSWTLLRTPGRFTRRPLPRAFCHKNVRSKAGFGP